MNERDGDWGDPWWREPDNPNPDDIWRWLAWAIPVCVLAWVAVIVLFRL